MKTKAIRAGMIILAGILIVVGITACKKLINRNKGDGLSDSSDTSSLSDVLAGLLLTSGVNAQDPFAGMPQGVTGSVQNSSPSSSSAAPDTSPAGGTTAVQQGESQTPEETQPQTVKPSVQIDKNDFSANIQNDFKYSVKDGYATIDSYLGKGGAVNIPEKLGGYPVIAIGYNAFSGVGGGAGQKITSVTIASGIEKIENNAFSSCTKLTSVAIPASVTYIGERAFSGSPGVVIKCSSSSYAATYANDNGIKIIN